MGINSSVRTTVSATCDNPGCRRGQNGPTVVSYVVEDVQKDQSKLPVEATRFYLITLPTNKVLAVCCPACGAEILGFPQPDITSPENLPDNVIPFCKKPLGEAVKPHSPENGPEESA